jgi:predicted RNA binding protein YcfA (HicA-like mRNA interferase family)
MKSSELHRLILQNGWIFLRSSGSHFIYEKNTKRYPVPYHGSKEVGKGIEKKIRKEMKLES